VFRLVAPKGARKRRTGKSSRSSIKRTLCTKKPRRVKKEKSPSARGEGTLGNIA